MAEPIHPTTPESAAGKPSAGMGNTVVKGAVWTSLANVARITSAVLIIPILSRFLDLADFGIMQIAMPVILFLMIFNDVGLGPALVRAKNPSRAMWSSVLWTNLGLGLIMTGCLFAVAGPLADFFREPEVEPITQALSIALILNCLSIVPGSRLQRDFKFKQMTIVEVVSISCGIIAAIVSAMNGAGAWALVYQQITMFFVKTSMLWIFARNTTVAFEYKWSEIASVFGFSSNLLATRFITFFANNVPNFLIGRVIGVAALGAYSIAFRIMIVPVQIFAHGLTSVLLPTMSQFHMDTDRMRAACLRTYRLVALIIFPALAGIAALAEPLVLIALGDGMAAAGPILALIAPVGAVKAMLSSQSAMYMALGRADVLFKWATIEAAMISTAFAVGIQFGLIAAVQAYVVALLLVSLPSMKALLRLVNGTLLELGRALWPPVVISIAMTVVLRWVWHMDLPVLPAEPIFKLPVFVAAGVAIYGLGLLAFDRKAIGEFRTIAAAILSK